MDFSASQHAEFITPYEAELNMLLKKALSYIKGCYMHWMQFCIRVSRNHRLVPFDKLEKFKNFVSQLRTPDEKVFLKTASVISSGFPNVKHCLIGGYSLIFVMQSFLAYLS